MSFQNILQTTLRGAIEFKYNHLSPQQGLGLGLSFANKRFLWATNFRHFQRQGKLQFHIFFEATKSKVLRVFYLCLFNICRLKLSFLLKVTSQNWQFDLGTSFFAFFLGGETTETIFRFGLLVSFLHHRCQELLFLC